MWMQSLVREPAGRTGAAGSWLGSCVASKSPSNDLGPGREDSDTITDSPGKNDMAYEFRMPSLPSRQTSERRRTCTPTASSGGSLVSLQLFGHPFSSYTWKVLIALWADETPFKFRMLGPDHPENGDELRRRWPFGQFPLLVDDDRSVAEATCIIEHLQAHHSGPNRWIPDGELGRRVRFLDRVFDLRVMASMQAVVFDALRPAEHRNPADRSIARAA